MKLLLSFILLFTLQVRAQENVEWLQKSYHNFEIYYTSKDNSSIKEYEKFLFNGVQAVADTFKLGYKHKFSVYIFPDRNSLDKQWSEDWGMPGFKSQCWMVASGVAKRLDILSPQVWDKEACEHKASDKDEIQKIITHELTHVFNGQYNPDHNFDNVVDIGWYPEGLAVYTSGQLDAERIANLKSAIEKEEYPDSLKNFWSGKNRYGFSGTMVSYIRKNISRKDFIKLLSLVNQKELLDVVGKSEEELLAGWKKYVQSL